MSHVHRTLVEIRNTLKDLQSGTWNRFDEPLIIAIVSIDQAIMQHCPHDPDRYITHMDTPVKGANYLRLITCPLCDATAPAALIAKEAS